MRIGEALNFSLINKVHLNNDNKNLLILGAGEYGQVANEVAQSMGCFNKIAFLDDCSDIAIGRLDDYEEYASDFAYAFVAIGNAELRLKYIRKLECAGFTVATLLSSKAYISPSARLAAGVIVEPMAIINANTSVGVGVIICAGAIVNHNATVGEGCQLDCGSVVGAGVVVPAKTKLKYNEVFYNIK